MYQHIEELLSRREEKVGMFLTIGNSAGIVLVGLPAYLMSLHWPFIARVIIIIIGVSVGFGMTLHSGGLTGYERVLWVARGWVRRMFNRQPITPHALSGKGVIVQINTPMPRDGLVRRRVAPPLTHSRDHHAHL